MHYIVFDLEFNQAFASFGSLNEKKKECPFEIIQIGAIKLDADFNTITTFNRYVKPAIYPEVNPYITDLTGITSEQLLPEKLFPEVFKDFMEFIGVEEYVLCVWGMADIKELFRNVAYHQLDNTISKKYINLQRKVSSHFGFSKAKQLGLQAAVETFQISMPYPFHSALHDAYYTAEILKRIKDPELQHKNYDPNYVTPRTITPKKSIDFEKLLQQFEKMYDRELSKEEQDMIILAYKMGKSQQFLKS